MSQFLLPLTITPYTHQGGWIMEELEYPYQFKYTKRTRDTKEGFWFNGDIGNQIGWDFYEKDSLGTLLETKESIQELLAVLKPKDQRIFLLLLNYSNPRKRNVNRKDLLDMLHGKNNWNVSDARNFNNAMKRIKTKAYEIGLQNYYWFGNNVPSEPPVPIAILPCHAYAKKTGRGLPEPQFKRHKNVYPKVKELQEKHGEVRTYFLPNKNN